VVGIQTVYTLIKIISIINVQTTIKPGNHEKNSQFVTHGSKALLLLFKIQRKQKGTLDRAQAIRPLRNA
jgi:hypothetical protein